MSAATLARAHRPRETVYAVFSAIAHERDPAAKDVEHLGAAYGAATANAALTRLPAGTYELT